MSWREWFRLPPQPRFGYEYRPREGREGDWVVYERMDIGWWYPITSRSSERSAQVYIEEREAKCKKRN